MDGESTGSKGKRQIFRKGSSIKMVDTLDLIIEVLRQLMNSLNFYY